MKHRLHGQVIFRIGVEIETCREMPELVRGHVHADMSRDHLADLLGSVCWLLCSPG